MIVVDVETGGLDPRLNPLLSIGAVDYNNQSNTFYMEFLALSNLECTQEALDINGRDPKTGETLLYGMSEFLKWINNIEDKALAGHNPAFDRDFCNTAFRTAGFDFQFNYRTVDLHSIAYLRFGKSLSTDNIYKKLGVDTEPKPHNALTGAKYETQAFNILCRL